MKHGTTGYRNGCRCEVCKDATYTYTRERYARNRAEAVAQLGGRCVECSTTEDLEFDHIDPETKTEDFAHVMLWSYKRRTTALAKAQLLCKPCHTSKSSFERWAKQEYQECPRCCGTGRTKVPYWGSVS